MTQTQIEPFALSHSFFDVLAAAGVKIRSRLQHGPSGLAVVIVMPDKRHGSIVVSQSDAPDDPVEYLHASISLDTMPTYEDMVLLHRAVFGRRRWAYEVFAPESDHVNLNPTALHLWGRADGKPMMPNFGVFGTI
jgi:hypothetical protein